MIAYHYCAIHGREECLMGGEDGTASYAVTYLRIAAVGLPAAFLALGGQGYLRGVSDLKTPLVIVVVGNAVNVVLEVLFVYGLDWGIRGSAWGTAIAQLGMGVGFIAVILRGLHAGEARPVLALARRVLSLGKWILPYALSGSIFAATSAGSATFLDGCA